jgi:hypothetical protein
MAEKLSVPWIFAQRHGDEVIELLKKIDQARRDENARVAEAKRAAKRQATEKSKAAEKLKKNVAAAARSRRLPMGVIQTPEHMVCHDNFFCFVNNLTSHCSSICLLHPFGNRCPHNSAHLRPHRLSLGPRLHRACLICSITPFTQPVFIPLLLLQSTQFLMETGHHHDNSLNISTTLSLHFRPLTPPSTQLFRLRGLALYHRTSRAPLIPGQLQPTQYNILLNSCLVLISTNHHTTRIYQL